MNYIGCFQFKWAYVKQREIKHKDVMLVIRKCIEICMPRYMYAMFDSSRNCFCGGYPGKADSKQPIECKAGCIISSPPGVGYCGSHFRISVYMTGLTLFIHLLSSEVYSLLVLIYADYIDVGCS